MNAIIDDMCEAILAVQLCMKIALLSKKKESSKTINSVL